MARRSVRGFTRRLTLDIRPAFKEVGLAEVVRQIGEEFGEDELIRQIGRDRLIRQIGKDLPDSKRRELQRLLSEYKS